MVSWESQVDVFSDACGVLSEKSIEVLFILGHCDIPIVDLPSGLMPGMSIEAIHLRLRREVPACNKIPTEKFKYVYGHTHCNRMMITNTSYLVAGQGVGGCGNYGFPVFDTTNNEFKVYHFLLKDLMRNIDNYDEIYDCIYKNGVTNCYHLAEDWTVRAP